MCIRDRKYNDKALHYDKAMVKKEIDKAKVYNKSILGTEVHDPFVPGSGVVIPDNYNDIMNVASGIMGTCLLYTSLRSCL